MTNSGSRIVIRRRADEVSIVIPQNTGTSRWGRAVLLVLPLGLGAVCIALLGRALGGHPSPRDLELPILLGTLGVAVSLLALLALALVWRLFGEEEIVADRIALTLVRNLKLVRWKRRFPLGEVTNIRWRERRVRSKGGTYLRRTIAFDVAGKTIELSSQLSYAEANQVEENLRRVIDECRQG